MIPGRLRPNFNSLQNGLISTQDPGSEPRHEQIPRRTDPHSARTAAQQWSYDRRGASTDSGLGYHRRTRGVEEHWVNGRNFAYQACPLARRAQKLVNRADRGGGQIRGAGISLEMGPTARSADLAAHHRSLGSNERVPQFRIGCERAVKFGSSGGRSISLERAPQERRERGCWAAVWKSRAAVAGPPQ